MSQLMSNHDEALADEARGWIVRMASGSMQADELAAFKAWRAAAPEHNEAFERERALWRGLQAVRQASPRRFWRSAGFGVLAAAACLALVVLSPRAILWWQSDYRTGSGVETVSLPDGSSAILNAHSAIAVHFSATERRVVLLRGEAWFDVRHAPSRPFRVAALGGSTEDIGTSFDVLRDGDRVTIGVSSGIVRVSSSSDKVLHAGDRAHYEKGGPVVPEAVTTPAAIGTWRDGELLVDNASVAGAIRQIARYRGSPVFLIGDTANRPLVSGVFRTDRPDDALQAIATMAHLRMTTLPGGIILLRAAR